MSKIKEKVWVMPKWMEKYREIISHFTGGNPIEELMNDDGTNSNIFNNAPRALICVSTKSVVEALEMLKQKDLIV